MFIKTLYIFHRQQFEFEFFQICVFQFSNLGHTRTVCSQEISAAASAESTATGPHFDATPLRLSADDPN
jgi:hypothetical protein